MQRWVNRGTHKGEFMGVPATGKEVEIQGITIYRIAAGTIVEMWDEVGRLFAVDQSTNRLPD